MTMVYFVILFSRLLRRKNKIAEPVNSLDPQLASDFCAYSTAQYSVSFLTVDEGWASDLKR